VLARPVGELILVLPNCFCNPCVTLNTPPLRDLGQRVPRGGPHILAEITTLGWRISSRSTVMSVPSSPVRPRIAARSRRPATWVTAEEYSDGAPSKAAAARLQRSASAFAMSPPLLLDALDHLLSRSLRGSGTREGVEGVALRFRLALGKAACTSSSSDIDGRRAHDRGVPMTTPARAQVSATASVIVR